MICTTGTFAFLLLIVSARNKAACHLKLKQHQDARRCCNNVLKEETENVKAIG